jgi:hypothetical protein
MNATRIAAAVTGLVLLGGTQAEAAWAKSGPGTAFAKADKLSAPATLTVTTVKCNGVNKTVNVTWSAVPLATGYELDATDKSGNSFTKVTTTSSTSLTNLDLPYKPAVLTVHGTLGFWNGPSSPSATGCP